VTIYYADAQDGDDGNAGTSWALAKATLQAAYGLCSDGDEIRCRGVFSAGISSTPINLTISGAEGATISAPSRGIGDAIDTVAYQKTLWFRNIVFDGWNVGLRARYRRATIRVQNCIFRDCNYGIFHTCSEDYVYLYSENNLFENCDRAIYLSPGSGDTTYSYSENDTFNGCTYAYSENGSGSRYLYPTAAYVHSGRAIHVPTTLSGLTSDWNAFNVANGVDWHYNGTDYATLAAWQAAMSQDANSVELDGDINDDTVLGGGYPVPGAACNLLGINGHGKAGGQYGNLGYGVQRSTLTLSNSKNAALWTGGVFTNTAIDGNGHIYKTQSGGSYATDVIDLGAVDDVFLLDFGVDEMDVGDTVQVRYSNTPFAKGDGSPAWIDYRQRGRLADFLVPTYQYRYWQAKYVFA